MTAFTWDRTAAEQHARAAAASKRPWPARNLGGEPAPRGRVLSTTTPAKRLADLADTQARLLAAGALRYVPHPLLDEWNAAHDRAPVQGSVDWLALTPAQRHTKTSRRPARRPTQPGGLYMPATRKTPAAAPVKTAGAPRPGSTMAAVLDVLKAARGPMHHAKVTEKILAEQLAPGLKGKTPGETIKAQMSVAAVKGRLVKTAPGTFDLAERVQRRAAREAAKSSADTK